MPLVPITRASKKAIQSQLKTFIAGLVCRYPKLPCFLPVNQGWDGDHGVETLLHTHFLQFFKHTYAGYGSQYDHQKRFIFIHFLFSRDKTQSMRKTRA